MTAEELLRYEAERSLCPVCKGPVWHRRGDFVSDGCRACDPDIGRWDEPYKPQALELACRWALGRIEELEEELERVRQPWRGPDRKTRLERGWQPAGKFTD